MRAVVFHGIGDIRLDDVPPPELVESTDAIVRITASAICGTDLHMVRGTLPGMVPGTILGHEGIGIVEATFPIGKAMNKNLTLNMGNCHHRKYIPELIQLVRSGGFHPSQILSHHASLVDAVDAYKAFDRREPGWTKVELRNAS